MIALDDLNADQRAAIEHGDGPVRIVAGPGSGKTKTLAARIVYLLQTGRAGPPEILALTFTNKAAHEMRERVQTALGPHAQLPVINTFHALAQHLLPDETPLVDEVTRNTIIRSLKKDKVPKGLSVRDLGLTISRAKNALEPPVDAWLGNLVDAYNIELAARHLRDFDDLLLGLYQALQQQSLPQEPAYRFILVDEFQDTNGLQYAILQLLDRTKNVFVIGDPLQSIYGFRGANAAVFDRFEHDFPHAARITLKTNYRSARAIVRLAGALFPDAPQLRAYREDAGVARVHEVLNEYSEADWIVAQIEQQIGGSDMLRSSAHHAADAGRTFRHFAVLYRTHAVARTVQRALEKSGIPYQVAGEGSPYLSATVQTVLHSLAYLAGRTKSPEAKGFTTTQLRVLLDPLRAKHEHSLSARVQNIVEALALSFEKHESLRQFLNSLLPYDQTPLGDYLDHIQSLSEQAYYDPAAEAITLLTIHAAKGLEFPCLFLIAVEEGILPHIREGKPSDIQEEKRLFYVAVTRARDELHVLHARTRQGKPQELSSFIGGLPKALIEYVIDPALASQQQQARKRAHKRAQGSLF